MKTVLCGPPHSGKSCLRQGLKQAIRRIEGAPYPYMFAACPDGEGAWFSETAQRDLVEARQLKADYKAAFSWEFAFVRAQWVRDASQPLTVVDLGGKIDDKNRLIASYATHAVILAGDMNQVPPWQKFCSDLNLILIALIHSDYNGVADQIESEVPILRGTIHRLERNEDVSNRPMVQALARLLIRLSSVYS